MRYFLVLAVILFFASVRPGSAGYKECEYGNGKFVVSKLSKLKGMVVTHTRLHKDALIASNCQYDVRFVTKAGWVYTIEKMMPYEVEWPKKADPVKTAPPVPALPTGVEGLDFGG